MDTRFDNQLAGMSAEKRQVLEMSHEYLMPNRVETWLASGVPLSIGRREGYRIWDMDGQELQDFHLNGGVFNLGHRHPYLVETLKKGLDELDVGNHHFPSALRAKLAKDLAEKAPGDLHYTIFTPSGSEANDMAVKTARHATGRTKIVAFDIAYHGSSGLSGAVGDNDNAKFFGSAFEDELLRVPYDDLNALEDALKGRDVALFMAETIPATFGFPPPSDDYYRGVRRLCNEYGTLFLTDEVQTGLGRSGKVWAIEQYGVAPDMMSIGKGLGGGLYPMGALLLTKQAGAWLEERGWGYVSGFGGSEIGCLVGIEAFKISSSQETLTNVSEIAEHMSQGLKDIQSRHSYMFDVRQVGVIAALGFDDPIGGMKMAAALYQEGLWAMFAGYDRRYLQFKTGLLVDKAYCDEALTKIDAALKKVTSQ
eukprot:s1_g212.t1